MKGVEFMEKVLWVLKFGGYFILLYIGWLMFDYFLSHCKKGGRR
jgi:hypothetical protein